MLTYQYGKKEKNTKNLVGLTFVVLLHIVIGYFILTSNFKVSNIITPKVLELVQVIEEKKPVIPEPPPVEPVMQEILPQMVPPPPIIVQEIKIQQVNLEAIKAVTFVDKPPTVVPPTSRPGPVIEKPVVIAPPVKVNTSVGAACPNSQSIRTTMEYPKEARRQNITGDVVMKFIVAADGTIKDVSVVSSSHRLLNRAAEVAVRQFNCVGQGRDVTVEVPFTFKLTD